MASQIHWAWGEQVREDILDQKNDSDEEQEQFEVDDQDIELEEDDGEEWTGISESQNDSEPQSLTANDSEKGEAAGSSQPIASTSQTYLEPSAQILPSADYEVPLDGESYTLKHEFATDPLICFKKT